MKKNILSLLTIGLLAATTFVGCKKDTNNESLPAPAFSISKGSVTINTGETATIAGSVSAANTVNLKTFSVTTLGANVFDTTFAKTTTSYAFSKVVGPFTNAGTYAYTLTATDNNSQSSTETVTITVKSPAQISRYTAKLLGAQGNTSIGSFFATSNGSVYLQAAAKTNSDLIDFVYFYDASATLAAPSDAAAQSTFSGTANAISTWGVKNATHFTTSSLTQTQFDAAADDRDLDGAGSSTTTKVSNLVATNSTIYGFTTAAGKKGAFRVTSLTTGSAGNVTIEVIVQK